jgi:hypothetical protein
MSREHPRDYLSTITEGFRELGLADCHWTVELHDKPRLTSKSGLVDRCAHSQTRRVQGLYLAGIPTYRQQRSAGQDNRRASRKS